MLSSRSVSMFVAAVLSAGGMTFAAPVKTELKADNGHYTLVRDGQPYFIEGAGGGASKKFLQQCGGNSFRTWGGDDIDDQLDEAQKLGLTVTVGFWMGHERHHFDYNNEAAVAAQKERAIKLVKKYKDHPAVLMWAIGNEMEGFKEGDNRKIWEAVQDIAAEIKKIDPNHPTATVVAEIGGKRIELINEICKDVDIVGINSYGGGPSLSERYRKQGGTKPFMITEFGPPGTWEVGVNAWGAPSELTSTEKAKSYRATYEGSILKEKGKLCLGSYVFAWGNKQEATATWYGLFLPDETRLEAIDTMTQLWGGQLPANRCPQIKPLTIAKPSVKPGETISIKLDVTDPDNDNLRVEWKIYVDPAQYHTGGDTQPEPEQHPEYIVKGGLTGCELQMPKDSGGGYWIYAFVYDGKGGAAVSNAPVHVDGPPPKPKARTAKLPFKLFGDDVKETPYIWSGWMGDIAKLGMDEKSTENVKPGSKHVMKCEFKGDQGWGGIIWQSPANDWGEQAGGYNLTGAKRLTFWARGAEGGEKVKISLGVIKGKKFNDTGSASQDFVLTSDWKQYEIDLAGKDLSVIKTGFAWNVGAHGKPITFYLTDISYDATETASAAFKAPAAKLPFAVYEDGLSEMPYIPSVWMGDMGSMAVDDKWAVGPHSGNTCMKIEFKADKGFGGVVWQSPANDWGDQPGGYNLTGAKKLTFWAKGEAGGEVVDFRLGVIGKDKANADSGSANLSGVKLTNEWKQYEIDLAAKDLSKIKTGFVWALGAKGQPVTFYLDDIRYE
jgi:hypothetical protein